MKAHDVFPAVCYPDLFWKMAGENLDQDWYLMCPHEIMTVKDIVWKIVSEKNGSAAIGIVFMMQELRKGQFF